MKANKYVYMIIAMFFLSIILFTSCNKNKKIELKEYNIADGIRVEHGIVNYDQNIRQISYDGEPIKIVYFIDNQINTMEFGLVIYCDGYRQPYVLKEHSELEYMHIFEIEGGKRIEFDFAFDPVVGKKGDTVNLIFATVLYPSFYENSIDNPIYGIFHSFSQQDAWTVEIEKETDKTEISKTPLLAKYEDINAEVNNENVYFSLTQNAYLETQDKSTLTLELKFCSSIDQEYRLSFYVNHEIITIGENNYFDFQGKKDKTLFSTIDIPNAPLLEGSYIYAIAVPLKYRNISDDSTIPLLEKTETKLISKKR